MKLKIDCNEIENWVKNKRSEIQDREKEIFVLIKNKILAVVKDLDEKLIVLEGIDLEQRKVEDKIKLIEKADTIVPVGEIFIQFTGLSIERAKEMLKIVCTISLIPEPIRMSHLIASRIPSVESSGTASTLKVCKF